MVRSRSMLGRARLLALGVTAIATATAIVVGACGVEVVGKADGGVARGPDGAPLDPPGTLPLDGGVIPPRRDGCGAIEGRGPTMVRIDTDAAGVDGGFCIDSTEVTVGQYIDFLDASASGDAPPNDAGCATPTGYDGGGSAQHPARMVTWCDAVVFCAWAGKRLCTRSAAGEWAIACSENGRLSFSDGEGGAGCNINSVRPTPEPVPFDGGSCQGGYAGVFDLTGNLSEWVGEVCGAGDACEYRGGGWSSSLGDTCQAGYSSADTKNRGYPEVGIRCCN